jgi:rhamnosyltransferase
LNLLCKSDIGENIWLRCSSLKRSPYQHASIQQCIFQESKAITEKGERIQYHVKSGFRIFIPDFGDLRDGESAGLAKFRHLRSIEDPAGKKVVLFVCFAPNGLMRKHSFHYMRQLRDAGFIVYALAANDRADLEVFDPGQETCDALVSRENVGFDFAIWAATILKNPRILQASDLLLVNDSVIGPLFSMDRILTDIELSSADIVGLTDSSQIKYHIQSFFLYIKRPVIKSDAFLNFIIGIKSYIDKETVIKEYELNFISLMIAAGFRCEALFSLSRLRFSPKQNPSIECWRELLAAGFPFLKSELVRDNPCHDDLSDIESIVRSHGDDQYIINSFEYVPYWPPQARQV